MVTADNVVWWIASILVGAGSVPAALAIILILDRIKKALRSSNGSRILHFASAPAATELMPLISGLERSGIPFRGSELWILGRDGLYITNRNGKQWRRRLRKWKKKGLVIKYLLLEEVEDGARDELRNLNLGPNLEVRQLVHNAKTQEVARKLQTLHPTLFFGTDGNNAAWIEGLHRRNSMYAYNVDYVPPRVIHSSLEQRRRFESYEKDLRLIYDNSTPLALA